MLLRAARGMFPSADGAIDVVGSPPGPTDAVVAFTAHHVVAANVERSEVLSRLPGDDLGSPMKPPFLQWLAGRIGAPAGMQDLVMVGPDHRAEDPIHLRELPESVHPRMARAAQYRTGLRVFADDDDRAVLAVGRGLAGRWEVSLEVDEPHRGSGLGRRLATSARILTPHDEPLFAQVSPGNVASVRAFIAAGYRPVCAEVLFLKPVARPRP